MTRNTAGNPTRPGIGKLLIALVGLTGLLVAGLGGASPARAEPPGMPLGFAAAQSYPVGVTPQSVAVADLDRDGIPDLVVTNSGSNTVSVLLGKGNDTFQPGVDYA